MLICDMHAYMLSGMHTQERTGIPTCMLAGGLTGACAIERGTTHHGWRCQGHVETLSSQPSSHLWHLLELFELRSRPCQVSYKRSCRSVATARYVACDRSKRPLLVCTGLQVTPWSKSGGLADVCNSLPVQLAERGHRVMVVSPKYKDYPNAVNTGVRKRIGELGDAPVEVGGRSFA